MKQSLDMEPIENVYWFGLVGNGGGAPLRLGIGGRTRKGNGGGC